MVESTGNKILFKVGTGNVYPFPVRFIDASDVHCFINVNGVERELVASEFSVERKDDYSDGANVTLNIDPLPTGATLAIVRQCDPVQLVSFPINGKFPSKGNENALDKLTMIVQDLYERLNRAIAGSVTDRVTPEELLKSVFEASVSAQKSSREAAESAGASQESARAAQESEDKIADNLQKSIGLQIGTIFAFPSMVPPEGAYLLNGQTITNCSTLYPRFFEWVQSSGIRLIDNATYEAELASAGVCGGFVVDSSAGSVRLPSVTQGTLWGADSENAGQSLAAGLPNITGSFVPRDTVAFGTSAKNEGAFQLGTKTASTIVDFKDGYDGYAMDFDASSSNAIYGNSDTVQPPAIRVSWCIQVFNAATDLSEQESAQLASEMQTKAQTDLANVNSAGKRFIVDQFTYGVSEAREKNVIYQAETAGYAYVSAKASSNANTTDRMASMVIQGSPYADFSQHSIYARRNDISANASATHFQFIPEGWYYKFVTYNSTEENPRFFPVNSDN